MCSTHWCSSTFLLPSCCTLDKRSIVLIGCALFLGVTTAYAATELPVTLLQDTATLNAVLEAKQGFASAMIEGEGAFVDISYFASEPIDVFMVPLQANDSYLPTEFITASLPAAKEQTVRLDLRNTPGWKPTHQRWLMNVVSPSAETDAGFTNVTFVSSTLSQTLEALLRHLSIAEPYGPSSYHALRGYRALGTSVPVVVGIFLLLATAVLWKLKGTGTAIGSIVIITLLFQLRFGIDLLRFTHEHLSSYAHGTYDEAGSVYEIAKTLKNDQSLTALFVCYDGPDFQEKILRYLLYPVPVSHDGSGFSHAVVIGSPDWAGEGGTLRCREQSMKIAAQPQEFTDSSLLWHLKP